MSVRRVEKDPDALTMTVTVGAEEGMRMVLSQIEAVLASTPA